MTFKYKEKYGNYINGKFVDPVDGKFFDNITPINGKVLCQIARSNEKDINLALDAAHAAKMLGVKQVLLKEVLFETKLLK